VVTTNSPVEKEFWTRLIKRLESDMLNLAEDYSNKVLVTHTYNRTICNWDQNEIKRSRGKFVLNQLNQNVLKCVNLASPKAKREKYVPNYQAIKTTKSSNQGIFSSIINFIPVVDGSTGLLIVTTPRMYIVLQT